MILSGVLLIGVLIGAALLGHRRSSSRARARKLARLNGVKVWLVIMIIVIIMSVLLLLLSMMMMKRRKRKRRMVLIVMMIRASKLARLNVVKLS